MIKGPDKVLLREALKKLRNLMAVEFDLVIEEVASRRWLAERNRRKQPEANEFERGQWSAFCDVEDLLKGTSND